MYYNYCIKCTSGDVAYLYSRREMQLGRVDINKELQVKDVSEEFVNYVCNDCGEQWHVDLMEKEGLKTTEDMNAWDGECECT